MRYIVYFSIFCALIASGCERKIDSRSAEQLLIDSRSLYRQGQVDGAVKLLKKAIGLSPSNCQLHSDLAFMYNEECNKSYERAQYKLLSELVFKGARIDESNKEKLLIHYGYRKELCDLAIIKFSDVLKCDPSNWNARYYIAVEHYVQKKYQGAIVELNKIVQIKQHISSFVLLGKAYMKIGQYKLSVKALKRAIELDPVPRHYYLLGMAYKRDKNWNKYFEVAHKLKGLSREDYDALVQSSDTAEPW